MVNMFDIRDYIDLDDAGEPFTVFGETRNAIKFSSTAQLQNFISYLNDFIKFSISWEKPLSKLLDICEILVKDIGLSKGRSLVIILSSYTWIYCDDIEYANTDLNVYDWTSFGQWRQYQMTQDLDFNNRASDTTVHRCRCGSTNTQVSYTQLSLAFIEYRHRVQCLNCGNVGPARDNEPDAISAWNNQESKFQLQASNQNDSNNISNSEVALNLKQCSSFNQDDWHCTNPNCRKPIVYTPGAKFCIFCGQPLKERDLPASGAHLYKSNSDTNE